ncbi:MAG TPA: hypothetical protein VF633_06770 [Brevundimonas sp.]
MSVRPNRLPGPAHRALLVGACLFVLGIIAAPVATQVIDRRIDADSVWIDTGGVRGNRLASGVKANLEPAAAAAPSPGKRN